MQDNLNNIIQKNASSFTTDKQRTGFFENTQKLGFPTTKHEEWKYTNVKPWLAETFDFDASNQLQTTDLSQLPIPNLQGNIIYFINGKYNAQLSNIVTTGNNLQIIPIAEAIDNEHYKEHFAKIADCKTDAFSSFNTAVATQGLFIVVGKNTRIEEPIIIRYITDLGSKNTGANIRNLFIAEEGAEVQIAESYRTIGAEKAFTNAVTEIFVAANANVHYYKVQNETDNSAHIGTTGVLQKDNSIFTANTVTANGGLVRNNLNIKIDGQYAVANMYGLYIPNEKQHIDNHTSVDHMIPNSESNELYKGVLKDKSTGVFNGKIFVREDAQKTNAFQSCKNVLLSNDATMNTKPQLEIWADDVKCSHGTTTGQLDDDALFYLQSRGVSKPVAQSLLTLAFAQDVIDKFEIESIKLYLQELVAQKLYNS